MNNRNYKKIFICLSLIILFSPVAAFATEMQSGLIVEFQSTPLFNEANFLPSQSIARWVKVTNNSGQPQRIATEAINENDPNNFASQLNLTIKEGDAIIFGKTLADFFNQGETYLSDLVNGETTQYDFTVSFNSGSNNSYQGKTLGFDILVGFQGTGGKVSPGGGGGGGALPSGLTIQYEKDFYIGTTTAKISWFTSYKATSQVIYDTVPGVFNLNSLPNYGYAFSTAEEDTPANPKGVTYHEVEIIGLTPSTTYYFRCVSHGSLAVSQERSFTTLGVVEAPAEEEEVPIQEIILSPETLIPVKPVSEIATPEIGTPEMVATPEAGKEAKFDFGSFLAAISSLFKSQKLYWFLLIILAVIIILFFLRRKKK